VKLGSGTFTVAPGGAKPLALHLSKAGKALLAKHHGHLTGTIVISDKTPAGIVKATHSISISSRRARG
jgi:hypothetical protein